MLIEMLAVAGAVKLFKDVDTSVKLDERVLKKLAKAYETQGRSQVLIQQKKKEVDDALLKVMNRKHGILSTSMKEFLDLYQQLIKINFKMDKSLMNVTACKVKVKRENEKM